MKKITLIALSGVLLFACNNNTENIIKNTVTGNLSNLAVGSSVYLDYLTSTSVEPKDTAILNENGDFSFDYKLENEGYYRIRIDKQNFITLILDKEDTPIITADGENIMDTYTIEGSSESQKLKTYNLSIKNYISKQDSLNKIYQENQSKPDIIPQLEAAFKTISEKHSIASIKLINEDPSSLISIAAADQLNPDEHFDILVKIDNALAKKMPNSDYYKTFHARIEKLSKVMNGKMAPEITLNDKDGNPISLSSLKGNIVLIDFWASWCRPCRAENPNVVKAYEKYHNKGFEVFSVSLDGMPQQQNAKEAWLTAIEKDQLTWNNHVSELKGWQSVVVPLYGIEGIPFTVLLDKEGKIIAKNIRGEALHQKLELLFNN